MSFPQLKQKKTVVISYLIQLFAALDTHTETDGVICIHAVEPCLDTMGRHLTGFGKLSAISKLYRQFFSKFCVFIFYLRWWLSYELNDMHSTKNRLSGF